MGADSLPGGRGYSLGMGALTIGEDFLEREEFCYRDESPVEHALVLVEAISSPFAGVLRCGRDARSTQFRVAVGRRPLVQADAQTLRGPFTDGSTVVQGVGIPSLAWCGYAPHGRVGKEGATLMMPVVKQSTSTHTCSAKSHR